MQDIADQNDRVVSTTDPTQLSSLDEAELHRLWRVRLGRNVPSHLPRSLFQRLLYYRLQARAHRDLHHSLSATLDRVLAGDPPSQSAPGLRPGSVLVREHGGELHRVMVLENGFAWSGKTYSSLSETAYRHPMEWATVLWPRSERAP
jgi:hypothetical protein